MKKYFQFGLIYYSLVMRLLLCLKTGKYYSRLFSNGGLVDLKMKGDLNLPHGAKMTFINNSKKATLGNSRPCKLSVYEGATLSFKGTVGLSNTVIVATKSITIGNNVMIGGGVTIVDSDFHSMDYRDWHSTAQDVSKMKSEPVVIEDNVFIGMNTIVLKGVTIGEGSVIAAGSVVTKSIPQGEIWGGNPAVFMKKNNKWK